MTFFHFANCLSLAYVPYHLTYKLSGLAEYGAFWKCVTSGCVYMFTQLAKMMFLATFFPASTDDEDELLHVGDKEMPFDFVTEFLKSTVDLVDLFGIYLVMQRVAGKGQVKILVAGVGWAFAELLLTRVIFLWVGARGIEFDWKYIQKSFDSNISLVHYLTLACLVWLWMRREQQVLLQQQDQDGGRNTLSSNFKLTPVLVLLIALTSYKTLILDTLTHMLMFGVWTALAYKAVVTLCLAVVALQIYLGVTALIEKY